MRACRAEAFEVNKRLLTRDPGDTLVVENETFFVMGGVVSTNLASVVVRIDGTLRFSHHINHWPRGVNNSVLECLHFYNASNVTFTSAERGTIDGSGRVW